ncbi:Pectin lyase-like superfamily protein isoform 2 [Hibiscus syriacus]|uniref:Pectin lyase-like superfamily protein isoform 2 n=1 Tax=Hibiscus syriacus TaxID=106335 RepID=A0A6A3CU08_HIBSY|nr:Pectin lyase-like superfamily protein isoform 2 [Hibiscus syriacus]
MIGKAWPGQTMSEGRAFKFNTTEFGAVGDGVMDNTTAFERAVLAISKLGKKGGARFNVPPGKWLTTPFNLTSHVTLFLAEDAEILGIQDENRWPLMPPLPSYGYGREHRGPRYGSLIHDQNLTYVIITGNIGTINGHGQSWWKKYRQKLLNHTRGPLVQIMWSNDIVIANITLRDSLFWTFHPYDSKNVMVQNVTILAPVFEAPNTDGIDPAEHIHNANVSISSEMSGGVSNVTVENLIVWSSRRAVRIYTAAGRGEYVLGDLLTVSLLDLVLLDPLVLESSLSIEEPSEAGVQMIAFSDLKYKVWSDLTTSMICLNSKLLCYYWLPSEKGFLRGTLGSGMKTLAGSVAVANSSDRFSTDCKLVIHKMSLRRGHRTSFGHSRVVRFADSVDEIYVEPPSPIDDPTSPTPTDMPHVSGIGLTTPIRGAIVTERESTRVVLYENIGRLVALLVETRLRPRISTGDMTVSKYEIEFLKLLKYGFSLDEVFDIIVGRAKDTEKVEVFAPDIDRVDRDRSRKPSGQSVYFARPDKRTRTVSHQITPIDQTPAQTPIRSQTSVQTPDRIHNQDRTFGSVSRVDSRARLQSRWPYVSEARQPVLVYATRRSDRVEPETSACTETLFSLRVY